MMRFRLRTLLILMALGPPVLAFALICSVFGCTKKKYVSENSIKFGAFSFPIERDSSGITAQIDAHDGLVKWNIDVRAAESDSPPAEYEFARAPHMGVQISADSDMDLSSLDGHEFRVGTVPARSKELPDAGHCYVGIHLLNYNHLVRFLKASRGHAAIRWSFDATETSSVDPIKVRVVASELPLTEVSVWFENEEPSIERARSLAAKCFDLSDLGEPTIDRWMVRFMVKPAAN